MQAAPAKRQSARKVRSLQFSILYSYTSRGFPAAKIPDDAGSRSHVGNAFVKARVDQALVTCSEASLQHPEKIINIHPPPIPQYFGTAAVKFSRADKVIILQDIAFVNKLLVENTNGSIFC